MKILTGNEGAEKVTTYQKEAEETVHVTDISWRCKSEIVLLSSFGDLTKIFSHLRFFQLPAKVRFQRSVIV